MFKPVTTAVAKVRVYDEDKEYTSIFKGDPEGPYYPIDGGPEALLRDIRKDLEKS